MPGITGDLTVREYVVAGNNVGGPLSRCVYELNCVCGFVKRVKDGAAPYISYVSVALNVHLLLLLFNLD